jgi:hypothetical protein
MLERYGLFFGTLQTFHDSGYIDVVIKQSERLEQFARFLDAHASMTKGALVTKKEAL